jgi:hypothetical protein
MRTLFAIASIFVTASAASAADKPNIVYIMADELGYYELSSLGNPNIQTLGIVGK